MLVSMGVRFDMAVEGMVELFQPFAAPVILEAISRFPFHPKHAGLVFDGTPTDHLTVFSLRAPLRGMCHEKSVLRQSVHVVLECMGIDGKISWVLL